MNNRFWCVSDNLGNNVTVAAMSPGEAQQVAKEYLPGDIVSVGHGSPALAVTEA